MNTSAEHSAEHSIERSVTEVEGRLRQSLATVQAKAEKRLKSLRQYVVDRPVRSVAVAFAIGLGLARLLQNLK
jgi:ElaB/YqjD/DUF883 family membrane-anchored ribosome-binding protein